MQDIMLENFIDDEPNHIECSVFLPHSLIQVALSPAFLIFKQFKKHPRFLITCMQSLLTSSFPFTLIEFSPLLSS
jgi:hypothetical protein